jgi:hypothetical protein
MPIDMFEALYKGVNRAEIRNRRMMFHENEEARSRFIASFFAEIVSVFRSAIINQPEALLESKVGHKEGKDRASFLRREIRQRYLH